jgi:hypothetical protein
MFRRAVGIRQLLVLATTFLTLSNQVFAQFEDDTKKSANGPQNEKALTQRLKVGVEVTAVGGPCRGIYCTLPVPMDWPEQSVKVAEEKQTANVKSVTYRTLANGIKQMIVNIPAINANETASAYIILEISRSSVIPPSDVTKYSIPKKVPNTFTLFMNESPFIETRHPKIAALAKELPKEATGWERVEAIYDLVRSKVQYKEGPLKGAVKALADGNGDCEELTSLFIALCRQQGIPARTVWVPGHCYPEFYLVDDAGQGYWFPCQAAGTRAFGGIPEHRPVLQKGDNFADPDRPRERQRYVSEFMKGVAVKGGGEPNHKFIREVLPQ